MIISVYRKTVSLTNVPLIMMLFFFIIYPSHNHGNTAQIQIPELPRESRIMIAETLHLWKTKGEELWKGWTSINIPFNYIDKEYEYLIGHPEPPKDYTALGKDELLNCIVYGKKREKSENIAATTYINGFDCVAIGSPETLDLDTTRWVIVAIHEMFHVYQGVRGSVQKVATLDLAYGEDASWQINYPFPYDDEILQNSIHMQGYLLFQALSSDDDFNILYNALTLHEAISVYKELIMLKYGNLKNYKYSEFQEWKEGIAKYTEIKMAELAAGDYEPLSAFKNMNNFVSYKQLWDNNYKLQINVVRHCGKGTGGRITFYYLGYGKGLLLDKVLPEWKNYCFDKSTWLDDIFEMKRSELQKRMIQIVEKSEKQRF